MFMVSKPLLHCHSLHVFVLGHVNRRAVDCILQNSSFSISKQKPQDFLSCVDPLMEILVNSFSIKSTFCIVINVPKSGCQEEVIPSPFPIYRLCLIFFSRVMATPPPAPNLYPYPYPYPYLYRYPYPYP
jgi:hypothetical protein